MHPLTISAGIAFTVGTFLAIAIGSAPAAVGCAALLAITVTASLP